MSSRSARAARRRVARPQVLVDRYGQHYSAAEEDPMAALLGPGGGGDGGPPPDDGGGDPMGGPPPDDGSACVVPRLMGVTSPTRS